VLAGVAGITGAGLGSADLAASGFLSAFEMPKTAEAAEKAPKAKSSTPQDRRLARAFDVRVRAAKRERDLGGRGPPYRWRGGVASRPRYLLLKGLPHGKSGNVDSKAYDIYLGALRSGRPEDFERIPLGFVKLAIYSPPGPSS
jgi:hypothetical protein